MGLELGDVRPKCPQLGSSLCCCQQLVLELHHLTIYSRYVPLDGQERLWRLLLLRLDDDSISSIRLLPDPRNEGYPTRVHGPPVRSQAGVCSASHDT